MITLHDLQFEIYLSEQEIQDKIEELAVQIDNVYKKENILLICNLSGAFVFTADLSRKLSSSCEIEFVKYTSYSGTSSTQIITEKLALSKDYDNKHVLIVEDIIDTGYTLYHMIKKLSMYQMKSLRTVSLLQKPDALQYEIDIDFVGFQIPNEFVVGYGLDYDELGRNLGDIYKVVP